jgi:NAD(P)-dependent dehydrogenase (short-subunit alcohol dehydrogenase family)
MAVTLITGTSTGIGMATALHFARKGHQVYATMRNPQGGAGPLKDAAQAEGLTLHVSQLDVDDPSSCERAVNDVVADAGRIDVLVNNAGIGDLGVVEKTNDDIARAIFETNFFGPLRLIRAVVPAMRERGGGTIVNVSSVAGQISGAGMSLYSATKHALEALSLSLAVEVTQFGIRVAVIEPGFIATPIIGKAVAVIPTDDGSPYADLERRLHVLYSQAMQTGADPNIVAETIEHAVTTDDPKFRYPVGVDASAFLEGRRRMTDEQFINDLGGRMTDGEYWTKFAEDFPMPAAEPAAS